MQNASVVFSLTQVIDAIEDASVDVQWFANAETGELGCYDSRYTTMEEYDEYAFEGEEWLRLPDDRDRGDWRNMRDFAYAIGGAEGDELLDAIHGSGAFRNFRRAVERMGALQSWYAYKDERISELAIEWLEDNGLTWNDGRHENLKRDWRSLLPDALSVRLQLEVLDCTLSVCKLEKLSHGLLGGGFCSVTCTDEEISVVCETSKVPEDAIMREDGLRALKVKGPLDFGLIGILAKISTALAEAEVPLFAVSTYDTDYVLVKDEHLDDAIVALRGNRCIVG